MKNTVIKARFILVELGKMLPFAICIIVAICYAETITSVFTCNYVVFNDGGVAINTPISFVIGKLFKYDFILVCLLAILSTALRTCIWNKLCVLYLALQIFERQYFTSTELCENNIIIISAVNIVICCGLILKGITTTIKN